MLSVLTTGIDIRFNLSRLALGRRSAYRSFFLDSCPKGLNLLSSGVNRPPILNEWSHGWDTSQKSGVHIGVQLVSIIVKIG